MSKTTSRIQRDLGNEFISALDDIRQKVVEEGWSGQTQTASHYIQSTFDDPFAAMFGKAPELKPEAPAAAGFPEQWDTLWNDRDAREASAAAHELAKEMGGGQVDPQSRAWVSEMVSAQRDEAAQWESLWGRESKAEDESIVVEFENAEIG